MNVGAYHLDADTQARLMAESQSRREALARRRADRDQPKTEKRTALVDRRACPPPPDQDRRRFATMEDKLAAEAQAQQRPDSTRYTGSPSKFMDSLK